MWTVLLSSYFSVNATSLAAFFFFFNPELSLNPFIQQQQKKKTIYVDQTVFTYLYIEQTETDS